MTKFFLRLILILIIAWLVVGLEQERKKRFVEETENIQMFYDSLLNIENFKDYKLITYDDIYFLLPNSYYDRYDLTNESNAVLQYCNKDSNLFFVLYKNPLTSDSLAYNFSRDTYALSTLAGTRNIGEVIVIDSIYDYNVNNINAFKVEYMFIRTLNDATKDTFNISFLSLQNSKDVYMLYFYSRPVAFEQNKTVMNEIMKSVTLLNQ